MSLSREPGSPPNHFRIKVLCVILIPILLGAAITTSVATIASRRLLDERATLFGNAIADQLSASIADQLVQPDVLGLNVTLNNLLAKGDFSFASVYGPDNKLLAQAGKNSGNLTIFTRDVVFQNAAAGTLQIGLDPSYVDAPTITILFTSILVPLIFVILFALFAWSYADLVYLWLTAPRRSEVPAPTEQKLPEPANIESEEVADQVTVLIVKVRPARLSSRYEPLVFKSLALHGGSVQLTAGGDFVATFRTRSQIVQAIRSGLLVNAALHLGRDHITVKLGLHTTAPDGIERAKKQATYMASISDNVLLASKEVRQALGSSDQVTLQAFRSSLTPDGEVWFADALNGPNQELIQRQAKQLFDA